MFIIINLFLLSLDFIPATLLNYSQFIAFFIIVIVIVFFIIPKYLYFSKIQFVFNLCHLMLVTFHCLNSALAFIIPN